MYKKIDTHSHIFPSFDGPDSDFDLYQKKAKSINVVASFLAPGPCPKKVVDRKEYYPCLWQHDNGTVQYKKCIISDEKTVYEKVDKNPYSETNNTLFNAITIANIKNNVTKFYATPLFHPILDTDQELERLCSVKETVGIKLHGIATFTGPKDISRAHLNILKKYNKPLIVHTDLFKDPKSPIQTAYQLNHPSGWIKLAIESGIKLVALHGACLSKEAIDMAKGHPNIMIGTSPDLLMMSEPDRLDIPTKDLVKDLFNLVDANQILFDIDYSWNVNNRDLWHNLDWNMESRYIKAAKDNGFTKYEIEAYFYHNAINFFELENL